MTDRTTAPPDLRRASLPRRRGFLGSALALGAGLAAAARGRAARGQATPPPNDVAILNFALNFEYLGAEYYTYALTGAGIAAQGVATNGTGTPGPTTVRPNPAVPFATPLVRQFAAELLRDEQQHVRYIRTTLAGLGAAPIAKPAIDLLNSFNLAAQLAGLGTSFNPFADDTSFLLGAYILEDVCVTALIGAAPLLSNKNVLDGSAGLLGVESYQAGSIRTMLYQRGQGAATQAISQVRQNASGVEDFGVAQGPLNMGPAGTASIVLADPNALALPRTTRQVLNIAYLAPGATAGGFFPNGVNGTIR